jgi:hypothetical protein
MKVACTFLHSTSPAGTYLTGIANTESLSSAGPSPKLDGNVLPHRFHQAVGRDDQIPSLIGLLTLVLEPLTLLGRHVRAV